MSIENVPLLPSLSPELFRQRLAGLVDPQDAQAPERREEIKAAAVQFVASLPEVYGAALDRTALWDRIGTGLESACAKTPGADHEYFINEVLGHIKATPAAAAACDGIAATLATVGAWTETDRQAWILYIRTHLIPVLVHARAAWEGIKTARKGVKKSRNAQDPATLASFLPPEDAQ